MQKMSQQNKEGKKNIVCGFIGQGFIGKNYADDFEARGYDIVRYDNHEFIKNKWEIAKCDYVFIAVPTPSTPDGFDISIVDEVLGLIGTNKVAIIKSTIKLGETRKLQANHDDIVVIHSPEFLTEVNAKQDAKKPNRNIVGIADIGSETLYQTAKDILEILPEAPYNLICNYETAEAIKYGGNNWFYFKVVYMNMLYGLCSKFNVDFDIVKQAMANDPRIGFTHLDIEHKGGRGAGGHCFIKDFNCFRNMLAEHKDLYKEEDIANIIEAYNINLLGKSQKDKDLVDGVYGDNKYIKKLYDQKI